MYNPRLLESGRKPTIGFVSPAVSVVLAAAAIENRAVRELQLTTDANNYAITNGLSEALKGVPIPVGQTGGAHGRTYSRLTRLANHDEVDVCNGVIGGFLRQQLPGEANQKFVHAVSKVVGELHDNVASHANGVGFSAAQLYSQNGRDRIEFAIADCGCGMLRNVTRVVPEITDHGEAINWCLTRGNTTARRMTGMEQRLPPDCVVSPLPGNVTWRVDENHHVGEGLYTLTELVRLSQGSLWIWTGNFQYLIGPDGRTNNKVNDNRHWQGLAIEIELDINRVQDIGSNQRSAERLEQIAARIGI